MMDLNKLTEKIISCCEEVHKTLGPGYAERIYHSAMKVALEEKDLDFAFDEDFSVIYKDFRVGSFKCDLFVESQVMVSVNASFSDSTPEQEQQLKAELKAAERKTALWVNFGTDKLIVKKIGG